MPKSSGVERSKTSYTPPTDTQDSGPERLISPRMAQPTNPSVMRNNTQITPARPSPNATIGDLQGQVRGLSIRRPGATSNNTLPFVPAKGSHFKLNKNRVSMLNL